MVGALGLYADEAYLFDFRKKMPTMPEQKDWSHLPHHILVTIFSHLNRNDQVHAAYTCKSWSEIFSSPLLWTHFEFIFLGQPGQEKLLKCLETKGQYLKRVYIVLDQATQQNREDACSVVQKVAALTERRLQNLKIDFVGENPYFYAGREFVESLRVLFGPPPDECSVINHLTDIDLSRLKVSYDDDLINVLSQNNPHLQRLNIQNQVLVCKVSPICILRLVQRCRNLKDLFVYNCSLSEDILLAFTEADRHPLERLGMICRREEKYTKDLDGSAWKAVTDKLPNLRVTLSFDHTCPLHKVSEVMKPEVPVQELRLETFTYIYDEMRMATSYYSKYLEKVVINTPMSRNSPEFNQALVNLATQCNKLRSLHVFCVLEKDTVDQIFALRPEMYEKESYTLKYRDSPHPWIAGKDC